MLKLEKIRAAVADVCDPSIDYFRDLIRTKSLSGQEEAVVLRIKKEMEKLGYDDIVIDGFGNILGRIGHGKHHVAIDSHIDTVDVGDPSLWKVDPFAAVMKDGVIYGRGASDQKGGMAAATYAGHLIKKLGLSTEFTVWVVGSVFEEDCDGLCWQYILKNKVIEPAAVIITEPTNLQVYRGHRGRMEISVTTRGLSCHGSAPERGVNAVYKMAPIVSGIEKLHPTLKHNDFLGKGSVTISDIRSTSPSLCAVADSCTIHLDRRLTKGEDEELAVSEVRKVAGPEAEIKVLEFDSPSWKKCVFPTKKYYPTWLLEETHPLCRLALETHGEQFGKKAEAGKWVFSTNGIATMGMHGIPTVGFGPANEQYAHSPNDQCPAEHIPQAVTFYTHLLNRAGEVFPFK
jgi:putative selenium metabolism hydrolase